MGTVRCPRPHGGSALEIISVSGHELSKGGRWSIGRRPRNPCHIWASPHHEYLPESRYPRSQPWEVLLK